MPSCLGIYVQNNLIKYAKISKEHNSFKVEAYGVKFLDENIEKTIEQIVKETFSYQTPITINLEKEQYAYSNVFNLLKPQDQDRAIDTEFDYYCNNNNKNRNTIEYRSLKAQNLEDRDKVRVIYTYVDKMNIVEKMQLLDKYKVSKILPVTTAIPHLNRTIMQENCAVINIENNTEITTIVNGSIYKVDKIEDGMEKILNLISERESSIKRAYEICKNTTVYTKSGQNLKIEGNEYLDDIITYLMEIIDKIKDIIIQNGVEINNIYITGMGLIINNIDLLFQESFIDKKCEILIPYFIEKTSVKLNIKDYIEVNSAIALAIQGLDTKNQDNNFSTKGRTWDNITKILTSNVGDLGGSTKSKGKNKPKLTFKQILKTDLDYVEKMLMRASASLVLVIIIYAAITESIAEETKEKIEETEKVYANTTSEIAKVEEYETLVNEKTSEYQKVISAIDEANSKISENYSRKNEIPNFLIQIKTVVPAGVQVLEIKNPTSRKITILAQAKKYDQLGYFKAILEEEGILTDVTSSSASKQSDLISITINGTLVQESE